MFTKKDIRLEVRVRNNLVLSAMQKRGIESVSELCRQMRIPGQQTQMGRLINMKDAARDKNGNWVELADQLAAFFQCMPEDLFSESQQYNALEKNRAHAEIAYAEIRQLTARQTEPITPELAMQATQLRLALSAALSTLTPREERILRQRFGFETGVEETYEVIGQKFSVGGERIRQIEAKALRKLQHPSRKTKLAIAGGDKHVMKKEGTVKYELSVDEKVLKAL